uniref:Tetratricopeptide repeat protein n=1 Tax=Desulfobacca acetoxidans TaxID=60893 RepID=A0A7V4G9M0_9BACT
MISHVVAVLLTLALTAGAGLAQPSASQVVKEKSEVAFREYLKSGNYLAGEAKYQDAVAAYRKALSINPDSHEAYSLLGAALAQLGDNREAEAALRKAVALKPDYAEGYYHLGHFLKSLNRHAEAEEAFRKAKQYQRR